MSVTLFTSETAAAAPAWRPPHSLSKILLMPPSSVLAGALGWAIVLASVALIKGGGGMDSWEKR